VCDHAAPRIKKFGVQLVEKHVKYLWSAVGHLQLNYMSPGQLKYIRTKRTVTWTTRNQWEYLWSAAKFVTCVIV